MCLRVLLGEKLPILFILKGAENGAIRRKELPTYPQGALSSIFTFRVCELFYLHVLCIMLLFCRALLHDSAERLDGLQGLERVSARRCETPDPGSKRSARGQPRLARLRRVESDCCW